MRNNSGKTTPRLGDEEPLPPRWADRLLAWYVAPLLLEYVQGDLHEMFSKRVKQVGVNRARREYIWAVLQCFTPFFAKRPSRGRLVTQYPNPFLFSPAMIGNYFKIA